jgi:hypothetical protein
MKDKVEYIISITSKNATEFKLVFDSFEEKQKYIIKEFQYCKKENDIYVTSIGSNIAETKEERDKKRIEFAKKMGFAPSKHDRTRWIRHAAPIIPSTTPPPKGVA